MSELASKWSRLNTAGIVGEGYVRLRLGEVSTCPAYAARSIGLEHEALMIEVETASLPPVKTYPSSRAFAMRAHVLQPGRSGLTRLILELADPGYRDIFRVLVSDVVERLASAASQEATAVAMVQRVERWQSFLRRHGLSALSAELRRGLFGELVLLRELLAWGQSEDVAVAAWKGCFGAHHDFQFTAGSIEVKTTCSTAPHAFDISSVAQLEAPSAGRLFVYFLLLAEVEGGASSLVDLIDALRHRFVGAARDAFEDRLLEAGFIDAHRDFYEAPRYDIRSECFFEVTDGFPRIREATLPTGVEHVSYRVALAACQMFVVPRTRVSETMFGQGEST